MDLFPQFVREFGDRYRRRRFISPNLHLGAAAGATVLGLWATKPGSSCGQAEFVLKISYMLDLFIKTKQGTWLHLAGYCFGNSLVTYGQ